MPRWRLPPIVAILARRLAMPALTTIVLAFATPAMADPALWEVSGPSTKLYLFGTVHALRKGVVWETPAVAAALAASQVLYLEVADADDQPAVTALVMRLGIDTQRKLSAQLDAQDRDRLAHALSGLPGGAAAMDLMRPWMAAVTVSVVPLLRGGYDPNNGVDEALKAEAKRRGLAVEGLETLDQQTHILADMPEPMALGFLHAALDDVDKGPAELDELVTAWRDGDVTRQYALETADMRGQPAALYARLIATRNVNWAGKLASLLRTSHQTCFVAVGAGHLAGPQSVPALLQASGFTVRRIDKGG